MSHPRRPLAAILFLTGASLLALAQAPVKTVAVHAASLHVDIDPSSTAVGQIEPGAQVAILSSSRGYVQIFSGARGQGRSGWMPDKGLVRLTNPQAPELMFGAAAQLQAQAEAESGQEQAAKGAALLFYRVYQDFPNWPLAGEALYRAADIRWQLDEAELPPPIDIKHRRFPTDHWLKLVIKKFPATPWAARAAYHLLVKHFTCGEWALKPECIGKEIGVYRDYLKKYPASPVAADAAYQIVYREAAAWSIYSAPGAKHNAGQAKDYTRRIDRDAGAFAARFPNTVWAARLRFLRYEVDQGIPVYQASAGNPG